MSSDANRTIHDLTEVDPTADEPVIIGGSRREETEMDITPMIDITFLLLIFFLVASRLDPQGGVTLPHANFADAVATKGAVILTVAQGSGDHVSVFRENSLDPANQFTPGDLIVQEEEIVSYVLDNLGDVTKTVIVKAEPGVKQREIKRVMIAIGKADPELRIFVGVAEGKD